MICGNVNPDNILFFITLLLGPGTPQQSSPKSSGTARFWKDLALDFHIMTVPKTLFEKQLFHLDASHVPASQSSFTLNGYVDK